MYGQGACCACVANRSRAIRPIYQLPGTVKLNTIQHHTNTKEHNPFPALTFSWPDPYPALFQSYPSSPPPLLFSSPSLTLFSSSSSPLPLSSLLGAEESCGRERGYHHGASAGVSAGGQPGQGLPLEGRLCHRVQVTDDY